MIFPTNSVIATVTSDKNITSSVEDSVVLNRKMLL